MNIDMNKRGKEIQIFSYMEKNASDGTRTRDTRIKSPML